MVNTILRGKITTKIWNTQGFSEKKSNFLFFFLFAFDYRLEM